MRPSIVLLLVLLFPLAAQQIDWEIGRSTVLGLKIQQDDHRLNLRLQPDALAGNYQWQHPNFYLALGSLNLLPLLPVLSNRKPLPQLYSPHSKTLKGPWSGSQDNWKNNFSTLLASGREEPLGFTLGYLRQQEQQGILLLLHLLPQSFHPWQLDLLLANGSTLSAQTDPARSKEQPWLRPPAWQPPTQRQHYALSSRLQLHGAVWELWFASYYGGWKLPTYSYQSQLKLQLPLSAPHQLLCTALLFERHPWYQDFLGETTLYRRQLALRLRYQQRSLLMLDFTALALELRKEDFNSQLKNEFHLAVSLQTKPWRWDSSSQLTLEPQQWEFKQRLRATLTLRQSRLSMQAQFQPHPPGEAWWKLGFGWRWQFHPRLMLDFQPWLFSHGTTPFSLLASEQHLSLSLEGNPVRARLQLKLQRWVLAGASPPQFSANFTITLLLGKGTLPPALEPGLEQEEEDQLFPEPLP